MELKIQSNGWGMMFGVPAIVVDKYIKLATPSQIKVLLYLLRYQSSLIDTKAVSEALSINEELVEEAVLFWEQTELFKACESTCATQNVSVAMPAVKPLPEPIRSEASPTQTVAVVQRSSSEVNLTPSEIAAELHRNSGLMNLFRMAEQLTGKPLTHMHQRSLIWLHQYLSIPEDIILTVMSYCRSIDKPGVQYSEKLLSSWWNRGLCTLQQINEEIVSEQTRRSYLGFMTRTLDMKRPPTTKQKEFFFKWQTLGLADELVRYAYEKTYEQTGKLSLEYMDKIMYSWAEAGYKTREEVDMNDKLRQSSEALKTPKATPRRKKDAIPESPNADAYRSLIYNLDE